MRLVDCKQPAGDKSDHFTAVALYSAANGSPKRGSLRPCVRDKMPQQLAMKRRLRHEFRVTLRSDSELTAICFT